MRSTQSLDDNELLTWRVESSRRSPVLNVFGEADEESELVVQQTTSQRLESSNNNQQFKKPPVQMQSMSTWDTNNDELTFMEIFNMEFLQRAKTTFKALDQDGNGVLDIEEIKAGFTTMGIEDAYVDLKMLGSDSEGVQEFTFDDFVRAIKVQVRCGLISAHFKKQGVRTLNTKLTVLDYNENGNL
jgi:Ca2+-binding EF-hand superfamily protein